MESVNPETARHISNERKEDFPPIIPDIASWPINKLTEDRNAFVREVEDITFNSLTRKNHSFLKEVLQKTIYQEQNRMKEEPWHIDPPNDNLFWKKIRNRLPAQDNADPQDEINKKSAKNVKDLLSMVIHRYAEEIVGSFNVQTYHMIRRILTVLFRRLLAKGLDIRDLFGKNKKRVLERLKVYGPIEEIRELAKMGTLVILPTHSSNLDSVLIGYTNDLKAGLPLMAYGAGLNLYNYSLPAYFMNRLGAYRVDRRKKNAIYLATLNTVSRLAIEKGTNSSFFPGGTRSRSGEIEQKLKLGLLSTVIEAQRNILQSGKKTKIFIIPMVVSYHFVLEAKSLIEQHLKKTGKEKYIKSQNELKSIKSWMKFLYQFLSKSSDISISFGKPLDVMGNFVDSQGNSYDERSQYVALEDYFVSEGAISANHQRESVYTKRLGDIIATRYLAENIILSSHLVSYVAFQILKNHFINLDLFNLLRLAENEISFDMESFVKQTDVVIQLLKEKAANEELKLPEIFIKSAEEIVKDGIKKSGTYHTRQPLRLDKKGNIISQDFRLLYFYHNRIETYGFSNEIAWQAHPMIQVTA